MNQTKFVNSLNSTIVFNNNNTNTSSPSTDSSIQSEPSPPPLLQQQQQTTNYTLNNTKQSSSSINIITTPQHQIFNTISSKTLHNEDTLLIDEQQQQHQNLKTSNNILNTCKVFRTSPLITQQQHQQSPSGHLLIQTLNKKPVINHTKQLNTITLATVNSSSSTSQQTSSSSYPSSSSRINLPITPIQLTVSSTSTTPSINKITKCSQSCTTSSTPSSSSSPATNNTLGSSTAAKLILNGSVTNYENQLPTTLKITTPRQQQQQQQQIIKTAITSNSIQTTTPSMPKIVFSTIQQTNQVVPSTSTNLVIQPRFILTTTSSSGTTNTANLFSSNSTYSATPINLKNINSKLNETLSKTKIVDTKNFIKTTIVPQQQRSATTIVNSNLIESKLAIEEAQSSLFEFKNNLITQSHNLNSIITSSSSQQQRPTITQSPTTTISTNSFSNTNSSTPSPVQQPIFNLIQNPSSSKPNIIRKTKSKTDISQFRTDSPSFELSQSALNQIINNDQMVATKPATLILDNNIENTSFSSETRPVINGFNFQSQQHKNHTKMIVNLTKTTNNQTITSNDNEQQTVINSSPVRDLLNPTVNLLQQQPAILHIPCNIAPTSEQQTTSILGTFNIQPINSSSIVNQQDTLAPTARKRRINEFDSLLVKSEENTKIMDESQPLQKITRLNDSTAKFKTTLKKSKETFKSVDNLENIDLNVNKCIINVLDDETVKNLSKEFVYYDNYGIKWISKNTNPNSVTLLKYYKPTWKTRSNHFTRYSDVKIKEETKTINELTVEKDRFKNLNEWTFHYIISQFKELMNFENESLNFMSEVENLLKTRMNLTDKNVYETIKANSQRHLYVSEQLNEAHVLIQNIVKNKQKFVEILNRTPSSNANTSTRTTTNTTSGKNQTNKNASNNKKSLKSSSKPTLFKHTLKNESKSLMKSKLKNKE